MTIPARARAVGEGGVSSFDGAFSTLASALDQHLACPTTNGELPQAARGFVQAAKQRGLYVEDVIIRVKLLLSSLEPERRLERNAGRDAFREALVTLCIDEFYATP